MQKDDKIMEITSKALILILIFIFILIVIQFFFKNILIDILGIDNKIINFIANENNKTNIINEDYAKILYPLETQENNKEKLDNVKKYKEKIIKIENVLEKYSSERLYGYAKISELGNIYEKCINWNLIAIDNEKLPIYIGDGYWSAKLNKRDVNDSARRIIEFNEYLENKNIELLYVQAPYKIEDESNEGMLAIYNDYSKENINEFLGILKENNVQYLDLREEIRKDKLNTMNLFFKTDHHWLPETGVWATSKIAKKLNELYNMNINLEKYDISNYNTTIYENICLGSWGKKVTLAKTKPKYDTNLTVSIPSIGIKNNTGNFEETLIDNEKLEKIDYYNKITYDAYAYSNKSCMEIKNNLVNDNEKILVIKDSFANVVVPYLSQGIQNLYEIDLRFFTGSIKKYIDSNQITKVIIIYNPEIIGDPDDLDKEGLLVFE